MAGPQSVSIVSSSRSHGEAGYRNTFHKHLDSGSLEAGCGGSNSRCGAGPLCSTLLLTGGTLQTQFCPL